MKEEYAAIELIKNDTEQRFEMTVGSDMAITEFKQAHTKIYLTHTEVPASLEGKGAATAIIEKTLDYIKNNALKLIPLCPLVVAYIKRHADWKSILDESVTNI